MKGRREHRALAHREGHLDGDLHHRALGGVGSELAHQLDLIGALQRVMSRKREPVIYTVQTEGFSIEDAGYLIEEDAGQVQKLVA